MQKICSGEGVDEVDSWKVSERSFVESDQQGFVHAGYAFHAIGANKIGFEEVRDDLVDGPRSIGGATVEFFSGESPDRLCEFGTTCEVFMDSAGLGTHLFRLGCGEEGWGVGYTICGNPLSYTVLRRVFLVFLSSVSTMAEKFSEGSQERVAEIQCPTCLKFFVPELKAPEMPFCSMRCKMADLNRWFTEDVGLPVLPSLDDEEQEPEPPPSAPREWRFE